MKTIHSNPFQQLHAAESCCQAQYLSPSVSSPHADSCCAHHHADGVSGKWSSLVSGMLLLAGIVMSYIQLSWFQGTIQSVWYLLAFMPVGLPVLHAAWHSMRDKDFFNEFTLMLIASIGAFCIGEYPEAVAVMLLYTVGEMLQHGAVERATKNIGELLDVRPERAQVFRNGAFIEVAPKEVQVGERIEVKPGERIPLDGTLINESALFDTSALTGESMPRSIEVNGEVLAGMIAFNQKVDLEVKRPYEQSALARILSLVQEASARKAPTELFIRRFARIYTPLVLFLSALVVIIPAVVEWLAPSFDYVFADWLYRALVFLVISCPCALIISIPLGYYGGIGAASRAGILFKGGNYLNAITKLDSIAFDKTGTLTTGQFEVASVQAATLKKEELLAIIGTAEQKSTHPIAQAIQQYVRGQHISLHSALSMQEIAGYGVETIIDGKNVLVGNPRLLLMRKTVVPSKVLESEMTVVVCAIDGVYAGAVWLADKLKEDAVQAIRHLKELGVKDIHLLSGDKQSLVEKVARELEIPQAHGDLLPEDKATYIQKLSFHATRTVAFVGDGMNDAPVLALSNVGIAMGGLGSDAAIESADVVIQTDQPSKVATAIEIGRATQCIVWQNIIGAISMKVIILLAGVLGYASLWGAVFADVGVALLAVLNSIRILAKKFK
ncbi:heavy metal translocating P-type ATPase [Parabacteroides goldsteinii]|uniref:heavy metal translocating P-type ATPase n=1 Tax=Parabacteroides goldsteinii TaxID=328812 RepID=UPI00101DCD86|nr:heavy metal translocating P-type ATPase [Parabacteroides goldsteinii]